MSSNHSYASITQSSSHHDGEEKLHKKNSLKEIIKNKRSIDGPKYTGTSVMNQNHAQRRSNSHVFSQAAQERGICH